jgi:hypothetical protein
MVATVPCDILEASMLPPTTAIDVQMVCPKVAPVATPTAFLWVASCIEDHGLSSVIELDEQETAGKKKQFEEGI